MSPRILFTLASVALALVVVAGLLLRPRMRPQPVAATTPGSAPAPRVPEASPPENPQAVDAIAAQLHQLGFGLAPGAPASAPAHVAVAGAVRGLLRAPVLKSEYAPRRPLLLPKLVQAVNDPEVSGRELSVLIAQDPALTGTLLRIANSALYRIDSQPVESIDRAVALLGTTGLRSVIATALLQPVFKTSSMQFKRFPDITWEHTQFAGSAAEAHAAIVTDADPFAAQLLALLLGLGTILTFRAALDEYARSGVAPDAGTVAALINENEALVARRTAQDWGLSERILSALEEQSRTTPQPAASPLGQSLRFGRYCGAVALLYGKRLLDEPAAISALRSGGFGGPACERIWARLTKHMANA
jgi:HD-like signal output (HDOD) protein